MVLWVTVCFVNLRLTDCRSFGCGRHPRRTSCSDHNLPGAWNKQDGEEELNRSKSSLGRNPGLYFRDLLRQDRDPHHQPDVCLQGIEKCFLCLQERKKYCLIFHLD